MRLRRRARYGQPHGRLTSYPDWPGARPPAGWRGMTPIEANHATDLVSELRAELKGRVIAPGDAGYDEARTIFHGGYDHLRPAAIAKAADAEDVAAVVSLARRADAELAVRGGGHSGAGHSTTDGGIVLDLRDMRTLELELDDRTAWADGGLTAGEYTSAAAASGLATGFGDRGSVGIAGITLGGGVGFLVRKHGLTIDSLLAAEVVTADGRVFHTDADTHPDLFWAIRGGGGNFGVATKLKFRLHELDGVVGGMLLLPATPDVVEGVVAAADAAPEELSTIANVMRAPPMPFVPEEQHGKLVVMAMLAYAGEAEAGQRAIAPFRELAAPLADMVRPMRYPELFPPEPKDFHPVVTSRTTFAGGVDRSAAQTIVEWLGASTAEMAVAQLRVLGGAMSRVPVDSTAFAHRDKRLLVNLVAAYGDPDDRARHEEWVAGFADAVDDGTTGAYVNFVGEEGQAGVREAYPGRTWDRLAAIKARYDPDNVFRLNQNIPPAA
jgi:FAD/FMN-containing dehydrogenase